MEFLLLKSITAKKAKEMLPKFIDLIEQFANSPSPDYGEEPINFNA